MGKFSGFLLASDIDGTLLENNYINPENIKMIKYFTNEGGIFSISTGRSLIACNEVFKQICCISASVFENGCVVYDYAKNLFVYEKYLSNEDKLTVNYIYNNFKKIGIEIHSGDKVYSLRQTSESEDHQKYENIIAKYISLEDAIKLKWNKAMFFLDDDTENSNKIKDELSGKISNSLLMNTSAVLGGIKRNYLEQLPLNISKASALIKLLEYYNISKENLFAIGDYYNDLEMIKFSKIGATTSDAPDDIKKQSDYITCNCQQGAVADFIKYLDTIY